MGRSLLQRFAARFFVSGQNHLLHERQTIFGEEHVLGAAEADAFGAELAGDFGVARDIGVGANAELAAEFVGPAHELADVIVREIRLDRFRLAQIDVARGAIERNEIAFLDGDGFAADLRGEDLLLFVDADAAGADDAGPAHAARDDGRVAGLAADRGQNAFRHVHAVNIVGRGFLADQKHRAAGAPSRRRLPR